MLQQYPADCGRTERDLTSSHSESNVQYDKAVGLCHDQSSGSGRSISESKRCLQQPRDLLHARISSHGVCLFVCLLALLAQHTDLHTTVDGDNDMKC